MIFFHEHVNIKKTRQSKDIKWSAVPLPLFIRLKLFHLKQGSGPSRGRSPVEWEEILPSVCPLPPGPLNPLRGLEGPLRDLKSPLRGLEGLLRGLEVPLRGLEGPLRDLDSSLRGLLQDFVSYRGCCPKRK